MKKIERKFVGTPIHYAPPRLQVINLATLNLLCGSETEGYTEGTDYGEEEMW